jgi:hypothetical protein
MAEVREQCRHLERRFSTVEALQKFYRVYMKAISPLYSADNRAEVCMSSFGGRVKI